MTDINAPARQTADFRSFWMGGFEAASHRNQHGEQLDMIAGTKHLEYALSDYRLLQSEGIGTARDAFRWHLIDKGAEYDFSSFLPLLHAALETNTQVIWTLFHYGYPGNLDFFSPEFVNRFVKFARAAARLIADHTSDVPYWAPVNEISFFSWAGSRRFFQPCAEGRGNDIKRQLVRATIAACHVLRDVDPRCRFVYPDPIIHVVPPRTRIDLAEEALRYDNSQFEAWDMIAGIDAPELGGNLELLDIVGMNFYHSNQWELNGGRLEWERIPRDTRWIPLRHLMERVWTRYHRPLFLAETSHVGVGRPEWILETAEETALAIQNGVPIEGICLFPVIDRYDWGNPHHWHHSGLWDVNLADGSLHRILNFPYAQAFRTAKQIIGK